MATHLADILNIPDWQEHAQCTGTDQFVFFHDTLAGRKGAQHAALDNIAKSICIACPVQAECLEYALETNQGSGIWGGMTVKERKRLARRVS